MVIKKRLIEFFNKTCRWCKYFRGLDDPVFCDREEPCLSRKDLEEMRKVVEEEN